MEATEKNILISVLEREPHAEAWVHIEGKNVEQILDILADYKYRGVPVAV